jgi:hypothetical protein
MLNGNTTLDKILGNRSQPLQQIVLVLGQLTVTAKILTYIVGLENARRHWMRVVIYVVIIAMVMRWFGDAWASLYLKIHL